MDIINSIISILKTIQIRDIIDILAIALVIFGMFKLVRETRAVQLLKGVIVLFAIYVLALIFGLTMLTSLLRTFFEAAVLVVAVIFQPEIRKMLEQMGRKNTFKRLFIFPSHGKSDEWKKAVKKSISDAADTAVLFSRSKTGALLVFERETKLSDIAATGTILDAETSVALFGNIFFNKAPLHDGASIIRDGKLFAAGCILPLTDNKNVDINLGTRHRAALGISEVSDAVVLVVSEETGIISLAINGVLLRDFSRDALVEKLEEFLLGNYETDYSLPRHLLFRKRGKSDDEKQ